MLTVYLILLPLALSLLTFLIREEGSVKKLALTGALAEFGLALAAFFDYKFGCKCIIMASADWLLPLGITLRVGLDGIGLLLVLMTTLLVPLIMLSSFKHQYKSPNIFYGLILLMEMALVGVFASFDGMLFYIFWEIALIPAWFLIALWGGRERLKITFKFFIYTFSGSLLMLVALIFVYLRTPAPHSFAFEHMTSALLSQGEQTWIFAAFFIAFAIKIPVFPFHTWQPDTYSESPPAGSMLLAGIMLKMGIFGIIRWMIPLVPLAMNEWAYPAMILGVIGVVYGATIAIRQQDLKRLIAYSSISHVGLIAAASFVMSVQALQGAVIQMFSHGINIVGLFIVADIIERRTGTRSIGSLGGIATRAPRLAILFMIILLGSVALPLTNGFVGEFLMLLGIFESYPVLAAVAGLTIILSAVYMLWMYQRVMLGNTSSTTESFRDLSVSEMAALLPLAILVIWIGVYPSFLMDITIQDVMNLVGR